MLYVCATPIGNLEDITLRVLRILQEVDLIAAEDTRQTRKLLSYYDIHTPLTSLHQHNEEARSEEILIMLRDGKNIALVSDAGIPGISDPGEILIKEVTRAGLPITVLPGANAAITALVQSGLPCQPFSFYGFLPRRKKEKQSFLNSVQDLPSTMIFYESPYRLLDTLENMLEVWGDRPCAVARELTKKFEEVVRGSISELIQHFQEKTPRGEFVVVVEGHSRDHGQELLAENNGSTNLRQAVIEAMEKGLPKKEAIKEVARRYQCPKNEVYQAVIDLAAGALSGEIL